MQISNTAAVSYSSEKRRLFRKMDMGSNSTFRFWQETVGTLREFNKKAFYRGVGRAKVLH